MEHLYIISYDVRDRKRWRRVYKTMKGYGEWLQLSVFQCRLDKVRLLRLEEAVNEIINHKEDHILVLDLGPAEEVRPKILSIGLPFAPAVHEPVIV